MLRLNSFLLLKSAYNQKLHTAILKGDECSIINIIKANYDPEYDGFIPESINMDWLYNERLKEINDPEAVSYYK